MRGVEKPNSSVVTSALLGCFQNKETRQEFMNLIS
jgi:GTP cyclohydrolase I